MVLEYHKIQILTFSIIFLIIIYSYFQGYIISSQRVFMCLIYCSLLITLYFTYSIKVARGMITKQIRLIVDNIKNIMEIYQIENKKIALDKNTRKESLLQSSQNNKLEEKNKKIYHNSLIIVIFCFLFSFIISFLIWGFNNSKYKMYNLKLYSQKVIQKNMIILVGVLITQLIFSTFIIGNILPLNSEDIVRITVDTIFNDKNN